MYKVLSFLLYAILFNILSRLSFGDVCFNLFKFIYVVILLFVGLIFVKYGCLRILVYMLFFMVFNLFVNLMVLSLFVMVIDRFNFNFVSFCLGMLSMCNLLFVFVMYSLLLSDVKF